MKRKTLKLMLCLTLILAVAVPTSLPVMAAADSMEVFGDVVLTAGEAKPFEVRAIDSVAEGIDATYTGEHVLTVTGYTVAPDGTSYGSITDSVLGDTPLEADGSTDVTLTFAEGQAEMSLVLNNAAEQTLTFSLPGLGSCILTRDVDPATADHMDLTQDITAPAVNGGPFAQQPEITLEDEFDNVCTNDDATEVTVSKKDLANWTLDGDVTVKADAGIVAFDSLFATNNTDAELPNVQLAFNSGAMDEVTSSLVDLPAPSEITITAIAGAGGTISNEDAHQYNAGDDVTFNIEAKKGYHIKRVLVDDVYVGTPKRYTFTNAIDDHTIEAIFSKDKPEDDPETPDTPDTPDTPEPQPQQHKVCLTLGSTDSKVNGEDKAMDVAPVVTNGRTLLPLRFVLEALGAEVVYGEEDQTVTITLGEATIVLTLDQITATVNGEAVELDVAPYATEGRTMVPLRFISENLGFTVIYDYATEAITID